MKILLKNRCYINKSLELTLEEFKEKFAGELKTAIAQYQATNKSFLPKFCKKDKTEDDFYFDLRYNFNNFSNSSWFIDKIFKNHLPR